MRGQVLLLAILAYKIIFTHAVRIQCKDSQGKSVDWYILYKLPQDEKRSDLPLVATGLAHLYLDSNSKEFVYSSVSLNATNHALAYTLNQLYTDPDVKKNVSYLLYNDQLPNGPVSFDHGHTKGVVAFDSVNGFWLVHSLPHFPVPISAAKYFWPHNGLRNGQTFLCVSYDFKFFNVIGKQLLYNYPEIYDSNLVPHHASSNPNIKLLLSGKHVPSEPWNRTQLLVSSKGQKFLSFAKFTKFHKDLYSQWLSDYLREKLLVESWQDGPGDMPSACNIPYTVENIKKINFKSSKHPNLNVTFPDTKDHSKWAVTGSEDGQPWICIGDINRQNGQKKRGGGTVCLNDENVWQSFFNMIVEREKCP